MAQDRLVRGARIRELREHAELTQAEFAERIEIATESVGRLERETYQPSGETVIRLLLAFRLSAEELVSTGPLNRRKPPLTKTSRLIAELSERILPAQQRAVLQVVRQFLAARAPDGSTSHKAERNRKKNQS